MIIAIASGKGGTGKTTVATSLALSLEAPVRLLDCDVEEPNAHIFIRPENETRTTVTAMVPEVDLKRCTACGACDAICRFSAIVQMGKAVLTFPEMCHSCEGCLMVCPAGAISAGTRELGELIRGTAGSVELVYGSLRVGEAMSPPLIHRVKQEMSDSRINIIDAPPGTSCPVISALTGADFVLLVTEPTPFGLNDLILAVETVRTMKLPCGIVINRCDSGTDETRGYAERQGIPVMMEIPDRRDIAESYSRGVPACLAIPGMKQRFARLMTDIQRKTG
ncbi:MAG: ATP-binding protein [Thermodesulfobacteriota bacterium]